MGEDTKVLCAWCGKPLDDDAMRAYINSEGCESCGYGASTDVEVYCRNPECPKFNQVIYCKEVRQ